MKTTPVFQDIVGNTINPGDTVAYASYKNLGLILGTVTGLGRLDVQVTPPATAFNPAAESFRPNELVRV